MKKTYINPATEVVLLTAGFHICEGSINTITPVSGLDDEEPITPGGNNPGDFSRRRSLWDEEEE